MKESNGSVDIFQQKTSVIGSSSNVDSKSLFPELPDECLIGPIGNYVKDLRAKIEPHEAGVLVQILSMFGCAAGLNSYILIGPSMHPPRVYVLLVGDTARARKGTSYNYAKQFLQSVCLEFPKKFGQPLSSGSCMRFSKTLRAPVV